MRDDCVAVICGRTASFPARSRRTTLRRVLAYVERNPVRAGLVAEAEQYEWSSAAIHLGLVRDRWQLADEEGRRQQGGVEGWRSLLSAPEEGADLRLLRRCTYAGGRSATRPSWNGWRAVSKGNGAAGVLNNLPRSGLRYPTRCLEVVYVRNAKALNMWERSDGLAVFANSFRQADPFVPIRPNSFRQADPFDRPVRSRRSALPVWLFSPTASVRLTRSLPLRLTRSIPTRSLPFASPQADPLAPRAQESLSVRRPSGGGSPGWSRIA